MEITNLHGPFFVPRPVLLTTWPGFVPENQARPGSAFPPLTVTDYSTIQYTVGSAYSVALRHFSRMQAR